MKEKMTQKEALDMLSQMNVEVGLQNLAWYSQQGDFNKTELLLIAGMNPNEIYINEKKNNVYIFKNTGLSDHKEILELFLQHGAKINQQDGNGKTALHEAIERGSVDIVKLLIERGADVNILTNSKINALYMAENKKNAEIISLLKNAGARELTKEELKSHKQGKLIGTVSVIIVFALCIGFVGKMCSGSSSSNSGGGSSNSSGITHSCINCNKIYSGFGYATMAGEEYALTSNGGNQYCSRSCAKASRTGKFKNL